MPGRTPIPGGLRYRQVAAANTKTQKQMRSSPPEQAVSKDDLTLSQLAYVRFWMGEMVASLKVIPL